MTAEPQYNTFGATIRLISAHRWFLLFMTLLVTGAVVGGTLWLEKFEYRADAQLMVVQYADNTTVDGEKMLRSTEHISRNLTKIVGTTSFMDATIQDGSVPRDSLPTGNELERKELWNEKVQATSVPNSAIIQISAYDTSPERAAALAQAVSNTLIANAKDYHGANEFAISVKQIDKVLVSSKPVRPNMPATVVGGIALGAIGSLLYLFLVKEWRVFGMFLHHWRRNDHLRPAHPAHLYAPKVAEQAPVVAAFHEPEAESVEPQQIERVVLQTQPEPAAQHVPEPEVIVTAPQTQMVIDEVIVPQIHEENEVAREEKREQTIPKIEVEPIQKVEDVGVFAAEGAEAMQDEQTLAQQQVLYTEPEKTEESSQQERFDSTEQLQEADQVKNDLYTVISAENFAQALENAATVMLQGEGALVAWTHPELRQVAA